MGSALTDNLPRHPPTGQLHTAQLYQDTWHRSRGLLRADTRHGGCRESILATQQREIIVEQYSYIRNLTYSILWGILLIMTNIPNQLTLYILVGITTLFFFGVVLGKGIRIFYRKALSLFYILLYFISLEVIPLAGIITWAKQIV